MKKNTKFKQTEIGVIPEDWEIEELGTLGDFRNGINFNRTDFGEGYPVVNVKNLFRGRFATIDELDSVKEGTIKNIEGYRLHQGDILFARSSVKHAGAGQVAMVHQLPNKNTLFSGFIIRFRIQDKKKLNNDFLNYLLRSSIYREYLTRIATGTTITNLSQENLSQIPIILPNPPEQSAITKTLSDLDLKIELNQQMNKTLETIGQTIFKRGFIDFEFPNEKGEPYKSSGGKMVDSELGEIPQGWKVKELGDFIEFVKGRKPDVVFNDYEEGLLPQILIDVLDGGNPSFSEPKNMVTSNENDIIMVMDGASSGRTERGFSGILGSTLAKIKVNELNQDYVYYLLKGKEQEIKENTTGTSIPHADKKKIEKFLIVVSPKNILDNFESSILFKQILIRKENKNLLQVRDLLLPRLISGKIRVPIEVKA